MVEVEARTGMRHRTIDAAIVAIALSALADTISPSCTIKCACDGMLSCDIIGRMESASASYRYIVRSAGVRGGRAHVERTRIGVHDVVGLIMNGATVDDVCRSFPDLSRATVYECLAYYEDHRPEIDDLVAEQMRDPSS
jgi:uncharacterized protein (DUF433 family)